MPYSFRIPAPHPGANSPRLYMAGADLIVSWPDAGMAQDEAPKLPRAALAGAAGGSRDQDPDDDNIQIANSPAHATLLRLQKLLSDKLDPDDLSAAQELIQQLLSDTAPNGNGGMAGDRRLRGSHGYSRDFPHSNRLYRKVF